MPPRTRRTSSNHPTADSLSSSSNKPVLIPVVEIPASSSANSTRNVDMAVSKSNANNNKQTTVSSGSAASSRTVTPEKLQSVNANAQKKFNAGSTPVKFYEEEMKKMNMQRRAQVAQAQAKSRAKSSGFSLKSLAVKIVTLYALIAYFFICPNDPSRAPAVCKSYTQLESYRHQALNYVSPYTQPYVNTLKTQAEHIYSPYAKVAQPYYTKLNSIVTPQSEKIKSIYKGTIQPRLINAFTHSHQRIIPHFDKVSNQFNKVVNPYLNRYIGLVEELYDINVHPRIEEWNHLFHKTVGPHYTRTTAQASAIKNRAYPAVQHHAKHTVLPFANKTYHTTSNIYTNTIHPRLLTTLEYVKALLKGHFLPALKRFNSKYILPQVSKIQDKAWANKLKNNANEKVKEMDSDLGKVELEEEVSSLLLNKKAAPTAETTIAVVAPVTPVAAISSVSTSVSTTLLVSSTGTVISQATTTQTIEPTAVDIIEPKTDPIAIKISEEETKIQLNKEKRQALISLHDMYDIEIEKLGQTELKFLAERLTSLRKNALRDIPVRFNVAVKNFREDCDKWIGRVEKYYDKAAKDERTSTDDKIADGVFIARKARSKLADQADELEDEVDSYSRTHNVRELTSIDKAFKTIQNFIGEAQEKLGSGYTWLDDVTAKDWTRYHTLGAAEGAWHYQLSALKNGTIRHSSLDKTLSVADALEALKIELNAVSDEAETRLTAVQNMGEKRIRGQFTGIKDAVQQGQDKIVGAFEGATDYVKGTEATVTPTDVQGTVSSVYSEASASAESLYSAATDNAGNAYAAVASGAADVLSTVTSGAEDAYSTVSIGAEHVLSEISSVVLPTNVAKALDDAQSSLSSGLGAASQSLFKLAGVQPSPTDASQSASSLLAQATAYLVDVRDSAESIFSSYAVEATNSARSLAGLEATPTDAAGTVSSAYSVASESAASAAQKMVDEINSAAGNAQDLLSRIANDAYAAIPTVSLPGTDDLPAYTDVSSSLSSQLHQATRGAAKAAGVSVSPEGVAEHAASLYGEASSLAASAIDEASSQLHTATRTVAKAVGATPTPENAAEYIESIASDASEAVSKATAAVKQHIEL